MRVLQFIACASLAPWACADVTGTIFGTRLPINKDSCGVGG